ncbi:YaiI/YqxD family protein [Anaerotignum sp. MB30-C6]|uniref:YaiI/YqxD family protein n=1 Tax=Anaerotignum sp. MB30-C6 TaxID=3070814 RepID=UPI0027DAF10C|nr:YaiI/YqxD family protein [Anaerotignum sp. MB30-C6]WMI81992.1 YaiI/YqxD family protein [Anaerotignum sp. MB30-C6]
MKILVDADACPVKDIIVETAKKYTTEVYMVTDDSHILFYPEEHVHVITVDRGADSADLAIANRTEQGDICITADYGLATLILAKKAKVIHPNGFFYTAENIDRMLFERHLSREMRRQKKGRSGHIRKRTKEDDVAFLIVFEKAIKKIT